MKIWKKYFLIVFGLIPWLVWLYVISNALEWNGIISLDFMSKNEMYIEFALILIITIIFVSIFIIEAIKDLKEVRKRDGKKGNNN